MNFFDQIFYHPYNLGGNFIFFLGVLRFSMIVLSIEDSLVGALSDLRRQNGSEGHVWAARAFAATFVVL
jgi:hypothetical protein